jgi:hypothetical protein
MSGERQGWQTWTRFQDAGIVGKHVNFTDNDVVTAHALGKTGQTIGKCWPMDAAVAYTLAAAGPNAQLTSKEMINEYTRMASVMMTQKVAYGTVPNPNAFTCGHDEINGYIINLNSTKLIDGAIVFTNDRGAKHTFRSPDEDLQYTNYSMNSIFSDSMKEIREAIEAEHGCTRWKLTTGSWFHATHTMGECTAEDGVCNHHNINRHDDDSVIEEWVMIKNKNGIYDTLWSREKGEAAVSNGWNNNGVNRHSTTISPASVTLWKDVSRTLANTVDTKLVLKQINASLRRMTARNNNIVNKTGERNIATYCWKEWAWLAVMQSEIANTSKKNRKAGDIVNGWKYTKYDIRKSFGHEIAKFKWIPANVDDTKLYHVSVKGNSYYSDAILPYMFSTKAEAVQFKAYISLMAEKCGANSVSMQWDATLGKMNVHDNSKLTVRTDEETLWMTLDKDPEELLSPTECIKHVYFGTPQQNKLAREQVEPMSGSVIINTINKPTEEGA